MRARRRQRRCHRRATQLPAQLCSSLLPTSLNKSDLFPAVRACAREAGCLQRLQYLVDRDRRLRAERAVFRSDMHLRKKLRGVEEDGPLSVADVLVPGARGISKIDINRKL